MCRKILHACILDLSVLPDDWATRDFLPSCEMSRSLVSSDSGPIRWSDLKHKRSFKRRLAEEIEADLMKIRASEEQLVVAETADAGTVR